jgi:hypothetical protein
MGNTEYDGPALDWICIDYLAGGSILASAPVTEAKAAEAEEAADLTPGEFFTHAIERLIASEDEPLKALVIGTDAFEAAFGVVYPDLDFDVYTDGKPDTDELADDDA